MTHKTMELFSEISNRFPMLRKTLAGYCENLSTRTSWKEDSCFIVEFAFELAKRNGLDRNEALDAFAEFCIEFLKEQSHFLQSGQYSGAHKSFEQVVADCYSDDEYMNKYMIGYVFSCALFPHHYKQYVFFRDEFMPLIDDNILCVEFRVGHGLYLGTLLQKSRGRRGIGYDISEASVKLARTAMKILGVADRVKVEQCDACKVIETDISPFGACIASGLLEHLEDPGAFLRLISHKMEKGGLLFTMTPTNLPHPDHLIHFKTIDEIRELFDKAGFEVVREAVVEMGTYSTVTPFQQMLLRIDTPRIG
jgi:SAM-dependent methyltransferase